MLLLVAAMAAAWGFLFNQVPRAEAFAPGGVSSKQRRRHQTVTASTTAEAAIIAVPTAGTARALKDPRASPLRKKGRRSAQAPPTYGIWDLLIGPVAADLKLLQMPSELGPLATEVHRATEHLTRQERLAVLEALMRSYHAYRLRAPEAAQSEPKQKTLTVGAYMEENVAVARLLGASEVDGDTMVAALLCHAPVSLDAVEAEFGAQVGTILRGWKAMLAVESQLEIKSLINQYASFLWGGQGDNLRNLLLVVAKDWRAVALRVAWKKMEMEAPFQTKKDQIDASWACLNVYASLAEAAGMSLIKNALEDRAFQFLMPQEHQRIVKQLDARKGHYQKVLGQARREVLQALVEDPLFMSNVERVEVKGRIKSPYSVWKKMKRKRSTELDDLYDMVALRVVFSPLYAEEDANKKASAPEAPPTPAMLAARAEKDKNMCDYVLQQVVHKLRPHYKGRVKDYLGAKMKPNGYQSAHTTLAFRIRGETTPVEVQIRTSEMHSVAEHGLAAHCLYKGDRTLADVIERGQKEEQGGFAGKGDFLTWCQRMLDKTSVIVFSPDGRLLKLDRGATLLDFLKASYTTSKKVAASSKGMDASATLSAGSSSSSRLSSSSISHLYTHTHPSEPQQQPQQQRAPLRKKAKRSTQGMLLLNGQTAPALDHVLSTGDVISYM